MRRIPARPGGQAYKEVRGLSRGLDVLRALNRAPGGIATITELASATAIHRTTVKRLLETLRTQGFVRAGEREGQYDLTFEVRRLSEGFADEAWVTEVATPAMQAAVRELVWPCDLATVEAGDMVVRESTHRWSMLSQHRAMIGERMPLLVTAIGRAYFAACGEDERAALLELLRRRGGEAASRADDAATVQALLDDTRRRGYAVNEGEWLREADFAAVAVPVFAGPRLLAAVNLVFPKAAVSVQDLDARFVPALVRLATRIGRGSLAWIE